MSAMLEIHGVRAELAKAQARIKELEAEQMPAVLFDGNAVLNEARKVNKAIRPNDVSQVLDAVVRLIKSGQ